MTIASAGDNGVDVLTAARPSMTVSNIKLGDLETRAPQLHITARSGVNGPRLEALALALPNGLDLTPPHASNVITSTPAKTVVSDHGAKVLIKLKHPTDDLSLSIGAGALTETRALTRALLASTRDRSRSHQPIQLEIPILTTDTSGDSTATTANITIT